MPMSVQVVFHEMQSSEALERYIREKAGKLGSFYPNMICCHVDCEHLRGQNKQGGNFNVRMLLHVPGAEFVVNHDWHPDAYVAVRDAFHAARRQLEEHFRRQRGEIRFRDRHRPQAD